jgi:DNA recombination protein Rad52
MMFTPEQVTQLQAPLSASHVKERTQSGRKLSYVEGWHAIAEANRIFGFDGWSRETMDIRLVAERERPIGQQGATGWGVSYVAKVRVRVLGNEDIIREGVGTGHGIDRDLGLAHESAIKEAETDAMKRALMTFGNPFGLALYDKTQANVADEPAPQARQSGAGGNASPVKPSAPADSIALSAQSQALKLCKSLDDLDQWIADSAEAIAALDDDDRGRLFQRVEFMRGRLAKQVAA